MCISTPKVQPIVQTPAPTPTPQDPAVADARERERRRLAAARMGSTLLTGGSTMQAQTAPKQLLGQ